MDGADAFSELRVVTTAAWLADDLRAGTHLPVVHDLGLDVLPGRRRTAWWAGHRFIARLTVTPDVQLPDLTSPGPAWLAGVDADLLGRRVWCGPLGDVEECSLWDAGPAFAKPAEIKRVALPAALHPTREAFAAAALGAGLLASSWVVVSEPIDLTAEYRCFVAPVEGRPRVVAASAYVVDGITWDAWTPPFVPDVAVPWAFAEEVLDSTSGPAGWVLDVGRTADGQWVVVEANAAWSSAPYHADAVGVVASVLASQTPPVEPRWRWRSDPALDRWAAPLPVRRPAAVAGLSGLPHMGGL